MDDVILDDADDDDDGESTSTRKAGRIGSPLDDDTMRNMNGIIDLVIMVSNNNYCRPKKCGESVISVARKKGGSMLRPGGSLLARRSSRR